MQAFKNDVVEKYLKKTFKIINTRTLIILSDEIMANLFFFFPALQFSGFLTLLRKKRNLYTKGIAVLGASMYGSHGQVIEAGLLAYISDVCRFLFFFSIFPNLLYPLWSSLCSNSLE